MKGSSNICYLICALAFFFSCTKEKAKVQLVNTIKIEEDEFLNLRTIRKVEISDDGDIYIINDDSELLKIPCGKKHLELVYKLDYEKEKNKYSDIENYYHNYNFVKIFPDLDNRNYRVDLVSFHIEDSLIHLAVKFNGLKTRGKYFGNEAILQKMLNEIRTINTKGELISSTFIPMTADSIITESNSKPERSKPILGPQLGMYILHDTIYLKNAEDIRYHPIIAKTELSKINTQNVDSSDQVKSFLLPINTDPLYHRVNDYIFNSFYFDRDVDETLYFTDGKHLINLSTYDKALFVKDRFKHISAFKFLGDKYMIYDLKTDTSSARTLKLLNRDEMKAKTLIRSREDVKSYLFTENKVFALIKDNKSESYKVEEYEISY